MTDALAFDRRHIWHPYASMLDPLPTYHVESAAGVRIRLADGRQLVEAGQHLLQQNSEAVPRLHSHSWDSAARREGKMKLLYEPPGSNPGWRFTVPPA